MTSAEYIQAENLMRGKVAREMALKQMMQFDHDSKQQTLIGMAFAIYLSFVVNTPLAQMAAVAVVVAAGCILANGGILLHRKWDEYDAMETPELDGPQGWWRNPSVDDEPRGKLMIGITAGFAYCLPALLVIFHASLELFK